MICDDESLTIKGMQKMLSKLNDEIKIIAVCQNGKDALDKILALQPHIVFIDINMPFIDGLQVIEQVNAVGLNVKFVIFSGYRDFEYARKACSLNVIDYLLKPINQDKVKNVLERCIVQLIAELNTRQIVVLDKKEDSLHQQILSYINDNYHDVSCGLEQVGAAFNISASYVSKIIKKAADQTFSNYINMLRIDKAKGLLLNNGHLTYEEIAYRCGFASYHYFSRVFKEKTGMTAHDYQKLNEKINKR